LTARSGTIGRRSTSSISANAGGMSYPMSPTICPEAAARRRTGELSVLPKRGDEDIGFPAPML
jgi:hypothetical protein